MTYLDVTPGGNGAAVLVDSETGRRYILGRDNAVALAWRLLAVAASPNRVVANGTQPQPVPVPPPPIPFTPGPVDPKLAETAAINAELERLRNQPHPTPQPVPPPATGGTGTGFGKDSP